MDLQMEEGKNPFLDLYSGDMVRPAPPFPAESRRLLQVSTGGGRGKRNVVAGAADGPSTPGRPIFSFSVGNFSRKSVPSKWDDAEKWLVNGSSSHDESPAAHHHHHQFLQGPSHGVPPATSDVLLKDKWISEMECMRRSPTRQGFVFGDDKNNGLSVNSMKNNAAAAAAKDVAILEGINDIDHRETGTEMTPLASSTTSRCHTPAKSSSPVQHNTPATTSGPLDPSSLTVDVSHLRQDCGFLAKLQIGSLAPNHWSSREEEEEEVSKSLRHFEMTNNNECGPGKKQPGPWEEEAKAKNRLRYERELASIQAWVNLQSAKTEAQSKKLEVKIQKMRSNMEEKLMKRMSIVHRKAEEWRAAAQLEHEEEMKKVEGGRAQEKMINRKPFINVYPTNNSSCSCFCFPFNNHLM